MSLADGVSFIAASAGTGTFVLGTSRNSFLDLTDAVTDDELVDGQQVSYLAFDSPTTPTQREWGHGTFSAGSNSISRDTVLGGTAGPGTPVDFSVAPYVSLCVLAEDFLFADLLDTAISSPTTGQVPVWNGSAWANTTLNYFVPGCIYGLGITYQLSSRLLIAIGSCADSTGAVLINALSALQKTTGGAWTAGNNVGGMGNGLTIAASTWYYVFAINVTGFNPDFYFDTSPTAANAPTGTTAFRRIGAFKTDGSSNILPFYQNEDDFTWATPITEINNTTVSATTSHNITLAGAPPSIDTRSRFWITGAYVSGTDTIYVSSGGLAAQATSAPYGFKVNATGGPLAYHAEFPTPQANLLICTANANCDVTLVTEGYTDYRGRFGNP
jgi:hypothetical protein